MIDNSIIRILFVEDLPSDVTLAERELIKSGITFIGECVDTADGLHSSLKTFNPDIVISD